MEIPVTAGPWLVLGVVLGIVLGILLPVLAAVAVHLARRRRGSGGPPAAPDDPALDDLPGFLESPPGSVPVPPWPGSSWPALSSPPAAPPEPAVPARPDRGGGIGLLLAMALAALLLIGAAAAVAAAGRSDRAAGDVAADLRFGGLVLERQAVGVTVAYPRVLLRTDAGGTTAEIELPTFNCLRDTAPVDPASAGCTRSVTEFASLSEPDLAVRADDDGLLVTGAFPTSRRRNGLPPVPTARVLEVVLAVAPEGGGSAGDGVPAAGSLTLGDGRALTSDDDRNEVTYGD